MPTAWRGGLLVLPSLLLAALIIAYPAAELFSLSSHAVSRFGFVGRFTGLANLRSVLADPLFRASLWRTLVWTVAVVGGAVAISVPVAIVLTLDFAGRGLARAIVLLPWAVSLTMSAIVWRWALDGQSGLLDLTLLDLGIVGRPVVWLADAGTAFPAEIAIGILVSIPFTVTILLGGLASIQRDLYEAASLEGANAWQRFATITLPLLRPFVTIAVVLNVINVFNSFPIIWVLTEGGPANSTDILITYLYKLAFVFGRMGDAAAMSLVMFAILLGFTFLYLRLVRA